MRFLSANLTTPLLGTLVHGGITILLALLFCLALLVIAKRYGFTARQVISSYLYVLLLPCAFIAWGIRFGIRLESILTVFSLLWAIFCLTGAVITFFVILQVIEKIILLTHQVTTQALTDQYRSFQHDINNHLLVVSGLMGEEKYMEAELYLEKLHKTSNELNSFISTGNPILDILMKGKINSAEKDNITVSYSIMLPPAMEIDNMDLCTIFSNALDNAIRACLTENESNRRIEITAAVRYEFLLVEVINPFSDIRPSKPGIGLKNIESAAKKYQGSMETVQENGLFCLSVLLCYNRKAPFTNQR